LDKQCTMPSYSTHSMRMALGQVYGSSTGSKSLSSLLCVEEAISYLSSLRIYASSAYSSVSVRSRFGAIRSCFEGLPFFRASRRSYALTRKVRRFLLAGNVQSILDTLFDILVCVGNIRIRWCSHSGGVLLVAKFRWDECTRCWGPCLSWEALATGEVPKGVITPKGHWARFRNVVIAIFLPRTRDVPSASPDYVNLRHW
jgi:hypothetical protein